MAAVIALLLACSGGGEETGAAVADTVEDTAVVADCTDAPAVTWESWGEGFFTTWCQPCHSATTTDRSGAPEGIDFDTASDVRFWKAAVRRTVLEDGTMPLGGGLSDADAELLAVLLDLSLIHI